MKTFRASVSVTLKSKNGTMGGQTFRFGLDVGNAVVPSDVIAIAIKWAIEKHAWASRKDIKSCTVRCSMKEEK